MARDERLLPEPDDDRLLPEPEAERLLELRLVPDPDEPVLRDERDRVVFLSSSPLDDDDRADFERLELPRGLLVDISTSRVFVDCAGPRWASRTRRGRQSSNTPLVQDYS